MDPEIHDREEIPTEELLQFIWGKGVVRGRGLRTTCGKPVEIIRPGLPNRHSGPDFFNALARLDGVIWAGNVEIHLKTSDWNRHGHQFDPAYTNVILHVVLRDDGTAMDSRGRRIPVLVLNGPDTLFSRYGEMCGTDREIPCSPFLHLVPERVKSNWLYWLWKERIGQKTGRIMRIRNGASLSWEEVIYRVLSSGFGLPINSLPFELLAERTPLSYLLRFRDDQLLLEAILFGRAGLLQGKSGTGIYRGMLHRLYRTHTTPLPGPAIPGHLWKFFRLRPASFPTVRISQFATLIREHFPILAQVLETPDLTELEQLLRVNAGEFWETHYHFGKSSLPRNKSMGSESIRSLLINSIVPFYFAFSSLQGEDQFEKKALLIMHQLKGEINHIVKKWIKFGWKPRNAMESQALLQLYSGYCRHKRCLDCQIGTYYVTRSL